MGLKYGTGQGAGGGAQETGANTPHPLRTIQGTREPETLLPGLQVFSPETHPEHVDLGVGEGG